MKVNRWEIKTAEIVVFKRRQDFANRQTTTRGKSNRFVRIKGRWYNLRRHERRNCTILKFI